MFLMFPMFPIIPMNNGLTNNNMKPVRLYRLLQSICNFDEENIIPTKDLAKVGRKKIFDFYYPLSEKVDKETFEVNILNHFINRRIGFETPTAFKISLNSKLNEIMPTYNKMFDMLNGWDLFKDGESITKTTNIEYDEDGSYEKKNTGTDTMKNTGTDTMKNTGTDTTNNSGTNTIANTGTDTMVNSGTDTVANTGTDTNVETGNKTIDKRNSQMPQSEIGNVQDADYLTEYSLDTETYNNIQNQRTLNTQSQETIATQNQRTLNTQSQETLATQNQRTLNTQNEHVLNTQNQQTKNLTENNINNKNIDETITEAETHTEKDKIKIYKEFIENRTSIYSMIYKELETCFYGLL